MSSYDDNFSTESDSLFGGIPFDFNIEERYSPETEPAEIFVDLTKELQKHYEIRRGVFILQASEGTNYIATAVVSPDGERKNLNLRLPVQPSLFAHAAADGNIYSENFFGHFSGNSFEKRLIIDDETESFMLHPVKHDGRVVGLIAYSSDTTDAFVTFDSGILEQTALELGKRIVLAQASSII